MQPVDLDCSECGKRFQILGSIGSHLDARPCPECGAIVGEYQGTAEELQQEYQKYRAAHNRCEKIVDAMGQIAENQQKMFEGTGGSVYPDSMTSIERLEELKNHLQNLINRSEELV